MQRAVKNSAALQSKLEQIKTGAVKKTDLGTKSNQNVVQGKGGKYQVFETEKKFEEAGVRRKKKNYVLYESKLGTEKQTNLKKIEEPKPAPKLKPKPVPVARPRMEEKIITQKKRKEYLDNYQYHESKVIRRPDPNRVSIVSHKRLSDIVGGFYEEMTYQRQTMNDSGKLFSQKTTTTSRRGPAPSSRTVPAQSRDYRKETNARNAPRGNSKGTKTTTTTTTTTTKTTTTRSSSRPQNGRGTTTTTKKTVTRSQSSGRRH